MYQQKIHNFVQPETAVSNVPALLWLLLSRNTVAWNIISSVHFPALYLGGGSSLRAEVANIPPPHTPPPAHMGGQEETQSLQCVPGTSWGLETQHDKKLKWTLK